MLPDERIRAMIAAAGDDPKKTEGHLMGLISGLSSDKVRDPLIVIDTILDCISCNPMKGGMYAAYCYHILSVQRELMEELLRRFWERLTNFLSSPVLEITRIKCMICFLMDLCSFGVLDTNEYIRFLHFLLSRPLENIRDGDAEKRLDFFPLNIVATALLRTRSHVYNNYAEMIDPLVEKIGECPFQNEYVENGLSTGDRDGHGQTGDIPFMKQLKSLVLCRHTEEDWEVPERLQEMHEGLVQLTSYFRSLSSSHNDRESPRSLFSALYDANSSITDIPYPLKDFVIRPLDIPRALSMCVVKDEEGEETVLEPLKLSDIIGRDLMEAFPVNELHRAVSAPHYVLILYPARKSYVSAASTVPLCARVAIEEAVFALINTLQGSVYIASNKLTELAAIRPESKLIIMNAVFNKMLMPIDEDFAYKDNTKMFYFRLVECLVDRDRETVPYTTTFGFFSAVILRCIISETSATHFDFSTSRIVSRFFSHILIQSNFRYDFDPDFELGLESEVHPGVRTPDDTLTRHDGVCDLGERPDLHQGSTNTVTGRTTETSENQKDEDPLDEYILSMALTETVKVHSHADLKQKLPSIIQTFMPPDPVVYPLVPPALSYVMSEVKIKDPNPAQLIITLEVANIPEDAFLDVLEETSSDKTLFPVMVRIKLFIACLIEVGGTTPTHLDRVLSTHRGVIQALTEKYPVTEYMIARSIVCTVLSYWRDIPSKAIMCLRAICDIEFVSTKAVVMAVIMEGLSEHPVVDFLEMLLWQYSPTHVGSSLCQPELQDLGPCDSESVVSRSRKRKFSGSLEEGSECGTIGDGASSAGNIGEEKLGNGGLDNSLFYNDNEDDARAETESMAKELFTTIMNSLIEKFQSVTHDGNVEMHDPVSMRICDIITLFAREYVERVPAYIIEKNTQEETIPDVLRDIFRTIAYAAPCLTPCADRGELSITLGETQQDG